jgi:hypothetical protein
VEIGRAISIEYLPLPLRERKKNHWVSEAIATLNPVIFQVRGELDANAPLTSKI